MHSPTDEPLAGADQPSARSLVLSRTALREARAAVMASPLVRSGAPPAPIASLRVDLARAPERDKHVRLAQLLAERGVALDEAVLEAGKALALADDASLRGELAAWLAGLGRPEAAADCLRTALVGAGASAALGWMQVGALRARAGDASGAVVSFRAAARAAPTDPAPAELEALAEGWAPDAVGPEAGAAAHRRAAELRARAGDTPRAVQALARACEAVLRAGAHTISRDELCALADSLTELGRPDSADELLRMAWPAPDALAGARERVRRALDARSPALAVDVVLGLPTVAAAALDPRLDDLLAGAGLGALGGARHKDDRAKVVFDRKAQPVSRARALAALASGLSGAVVATMLATAAELEAEAGAHELALGHARDAYRADSTSLRASTVLAHILLRAPTAATSSLLDQALRKTLPRVELFLQASEAFARLNDAAAAGRWLERALALRPGDPTLVKRYLDDVARRGALGEVARRVRWVLAQPLPLSELAEPLCAAVERAYHEERTPAPGELPALASELARRVLDALGPRVAPVAAHIEAWASRSGDLALLVSCREREVATEPNPQQAVATLLELAALRSHGEDFDGSILELARALERGAPHSDVRERLFAVDEQRAEAGLALSSDGELARAVVLAGTLPRAASTGEVLEQVEALRALGALRFDLAGDRDGAHAALLEADRLAVTVSCSTYADDVALLFGLDELAARVEERVHDEVDAVGLASLSVTDPVSISTRRTCADLASTAARVCARDGQPALALRLSELALELEPTRSDALVLVERAAEAIGEPLRVGYAYQRAAESAYGPYGRRAAHYRAARQLATLGQPRAALQHALLSLEAVPSDGHSYQLVLELGQLPGAAADAVRGLERVADRCRSSERADWLLRAASMTTTTEDGLRERADILVRALATSADRRTLDALSDCVSTLRAEGLDLDTERERIARAASATLGRLDGPDGARVAIRFARLLLVELGDAPSALRLLERALECDADVDEYGELAAEAAELAAGDGAALFVASVTRLSEQPHACVGVGLAALTAAVAAGLASAEVASRGSEAGASETRLLAARWAVQAATLAPERADLVAAAVAAIGRTAAPDPLVVALRAAVSDEELVPALSRVVRDGVERGAPREALAAAYLCAPKADALRTVAIVQWMDLVRSTIAKEEAESLLAREADSTRDVTSRVAAARALARERTGHDGASALEVLLSALVGVASRNELAVASDLAAELRAAARSSAQAGWLARRVKGLLAELPRGSAMPESSLGVARVLAKLRASLLDELGDPEAADAHAVVVSLDPSDDGSLEALEQVALRDNDHVRIAELLALRIEANADPLARRALRLRRAALLDQRLGKAKEARAELSTLLTDAPGDRTVLRLVEQLDAQGIAEAAAASSSTPSGAMATSAESAESDAAAPSEGGSDAAPLPAEGNAPSAAASLAVPTAPVVREPSVRKPPPRPSAPSQRAASQLSELDDDVELLDEDALVDEALGDDSASDDRLSDPGSYREPPASVDGLDEAELFRRLVGGSFDAGEALVRLFGSELAARSRELLALRREQVRLRPGDAVVLEALRKAAQLDSNHALVRAVQHAEAALSSPSHSPPLLVAQPTVPEAVQAFLFRDRVLPVHKALALVWEAGLYRRELLAAGVSMAQRVMGRASPMGELVSALAPRLGLVRSAVYHAPEPGPLRSSVVLTMPPGVLLRGEPAAPLLDAFSLGSALAAAQPDFVLAVALPPNEGQLLTDALLAAFGPLDRAPASRTSAVGAVEQRLYQATPPRLERKLRELCEQAGDDLRFDLAATSARQAMRRAGLFACGDLSTALRVTLGELQVAVPEGPGALAAACAACPEAASLLSLATSAEYAEARWQADDRFRR